MLLFKIFYLGLLYCCLSESNPSEIRTLQLLTGTENVNLDCLVEHSGNYDVAWHHVSEYAVTQLSINKTTNLKFKTLFELEHDVKTQNYCLVIKKVSRHFEGLYICKLLTSETSVFSHVVKINVELYELPVDPKILCDIEKNDVVEGEIVTLYYNVFIGNLPANVSIFTVDTNGTYRAMEVHNPPHNQFDEVTLEINVTRNMKMFHFAVSHKLLQHSVICSTPKLTVYYPPRFQTMSNIIEYNIGDHLYIPINVISYPEANISWDCWRNNQSIDCSQAELTSELPGFYTLSNRKEFTEHENGTMITINATNDVGEDSHVINLYCSSNPSNTSEVNNTCTTIYYIAFICAFVFRFYF